MARLKKADHEKILAEHIKEIGIVSYICINGEGRRLNDLYYSFNLKNGEQRFYTNPSEKFLNEIIP